MANRYRPNSKYNSKSRGQGYRCKFCNDENTELDPLAQELACKSCGSIAKVNADDLKKLKIKKTKEPKKPDTSNMSMKQKMMVMTHIRDSVQPDKSACGISKSGKFSELKLTDNQEQSTCDRCNMNAY